MKNIIYPAVFEKADDGYTVYFPDLQGCITEGDTIEEAYKNARDVLALHIDGLTDLPEPSKIENMKKIENEVIMLIEAGSQENITYFTQTQFSDFFNKALDKKGFTKYEVAKILGVDRAYIGRISKGNRSPSVEMAKRIGALLEIDWRVFYKTQKQA